MDYLLGYPFYNETLGNITGIVPEQTDWTYIDKNVSDFMQMMWVNFTKYGWAVYITFYSSSVFLRLTWQRVESIYNAAECWNGFSSVSSCQLLHLDVWGLLVLHFLFSSPGKVEIIQMWGMIIHTTG